MEKEHFGITASSGEPCPARGVWRVEDIYESTIGQPKGTPMPTFRGKDVTWTFVQYAQQEMYD